MGVAAPNAVVSVFDRRSQCNNMILTSSHVANARTSLLLPVLWLYE